MSESTPPPEPTPESDSKSELKKLGTGQEVNDALLWEQMEEDRMDKMIATGEKALARFKARGNRYAWEVK
jgi:hypothetical protein